MAPEERFTRQIAALFTGHDLTLAVSNKRDPNFENFYSGWVGAPRALPTEYAEFDENWRVYVVPDSNQQATVDTLNTQLLDYLTSGQIPFAELVWEHGWIIAAGPVPDPEHAVQTRTAMLAAVDYVASLTPRWHLPETPVQITSLDEIVVRVRSIAPDIAVIAERPRRR